jgi:hypothetical protein
MPSGQLIPPSDQIHRGDLSDPAFSLLFLLFPLITEISQSSTLSGPSYNYEMADFSSIPIIDFGRLQDPSTKEETLVQLREAIFLVGFLYLTNHGMEVRIRAS